MTDAKPLSAEELTALETAVAGCPSLGIPPKPYPLMNWECRSLLATIRRRDELIRFAARHFDVSGLVDGSEDCPATEIMAIVEAGDE